MSSEKRSAQPVLSQSLFQTAYVPGRSWRSYATSTVLHGVVIALLLLVTVPAIQVVKKRQAEHITLLAPPPLPSYRPKPVPAPRHRLETPQPVVKNQPRPEVRPVIKPPEVKPITAPRRELAAAPEIKTEPRPSLPDLKSDLPTPKPPVRTGTFQPIDQARSAPVQKELKVGGFGDPHGVPANSSSHPSPAMLAQVGSFDQPVGAGRAGGGGHSASGGVRSTSFGSPGDPNGVSGGTGRGPGTVRTGAFGETGIGQAPAPAARPKPAEPAFSPVEILSKPKPRYTEEARNLKLEGQVALEVVFQANGSVRIIRVVHGLGHGLDEAAKEAAMQVRFRPATRGGTPVDSNATILITFQLT